MKPYRSLGGSTVVLAAACIISLFAAACGSERGEGASHGSAPRTTDVAQDSGGKAPPAPSIGCALFPGDNYWHADVSRLPVLPKSDTYIDSIGRDTTLQADFGAGVYGGLLDRHPVHGRRW